MKIFLIILLCWMGIGALMLHSVKTEKTKQNKTKMKQSLKSMPIALRIFTGIFVGIYFLIVYFVTPFVPIVSIFRKNKENS
jgi:phosphatidylserine synthase